MRGGWGRGGEGGEVGKGVGEAGKGGEGSVISMQEKALCYSGLNYSLPYIMIHSDIRRYKKESLSDGIRVTR